MCLLSARSVLGLESHKGGGKAAAASGQKASQGQRKKKLLNKGHARKRDNCNRKLKVAKHHETGNRKQE